jgi:hypothetical protein
LAASWRAAASGLPISSVMMRANASFSVSRISAARRIQAARSANVVWR